MIKIFLGMAGLAEYGIAAESGLSPDVAFSAHDRPLFLLLVASLAVEVKGFHQPRLASLIIHPMAVRAAPVLRRLIFHELAVFVDVVAFIAVFDLGFLIMGIVEEYGGRPLGIRKGVR
jgi:hypothetical protein